MSIILKGIDLPKEGEEITLAIFHDGDIVSYKYWLPKEAEAIQIPKDHGRLIDMRALFEDLNKYQIEYNADINKVISDAPMILAEEE